MRPAPPPTPARGGVPSRQEAERFCARWLPLWTGNRPDELAALYTEDATYRDPARPRGLRGRTEIRAYLGALLARNPDWVWEADAVFPLEGGFALRWRAAIPVGGRVVRETGLDLVVLRGGLIAHNEVYFDRTALLGAQPAPVPTR